MSDRPKAAWNAMLRCHVLSLSYDFAERAGRLDMPEGDSCDMTGAIAIFQAIDPAVVLIRTYAGGREDTSYHRGAGRGDWEAMVPPAG